MGTRSKVVIKCTASLFANTMKFFVLVGVALLCLVEAEIHEDFDERAGPVEEQDFDEPLKTDPKFDEFLKENPEFDEPLKTASKFTEALQADPKLADLVTASHEGAEDEDEDESVMNTNNDSKKGKKIIKYVARRIAIAFYKKCVYYSIRKCFFW